MSMMHYWIFQVRSLTPTCWWLLVVPPADQGSLRIEAGVVCLFVLFLQSLISPEKGFLRRLLEMASETSKALQPCPPLWPPPSVTHHSARQSAFPLTLPPPEQFPLPSKTELKGSRPSSCFLVFFFFLRLPAQKSWPAREAPHTTRPLGFLVT